MKLSLHRLIAITGVDYTTTVPDNSSQATQKRGCRATYNSYYYSAVYLIFYMSMLRDFLLQIFLAELCGGHEIWV